MMCRYAFVMVNVYVCSWFIVPYMVVYSGRESTVMNDRGRSVWVGRRGVRGRKLRKREGRVAVFQRPVGVGEILSVCDRVGTS